MRFDKYHINPKLKANLKSEGLLKTTDIQYKAIYPILQGKDVLAIAQTGTGKTAAFAIPMVHLAIHNKAAKNAPFGLVVVPTHELALQIEKVFKAFARKTGVKVKALIGGETHESQAKSLIKGVDIAIVTPGRVFDLRNIGILDTSKLRILVIDEADHMLGKGFLTDVKDLVKFMPKSRQTLFFSATINQEIKKVANALVKNAVHIHISPENPVSKNVDHFLTKVEMDDKRFFLERFIQEVDFAKTLVFVRTKVRAERVQAAMKRVGIETLTLHSDKSNQERKQNMENFRDGNINILIATDISARGVDIPNVEYVINYDLPEDPENYVHRVGRTGRGRSKGKAYSFCSSNEEEHLNNIEAYIGQRIEEIHIDQNEYEETLLSSKGSQKLTLEDIQKEMADFQRSKPKKKKK